MLAFARKSLRRGLPAAAAFALAAPLVQAIQRALDPHPKGDPFIFPALLLVPAAGLFLGAAAVSDERESGALEFALSLPLSGNALFARLFAAGALPLALLAPVLWFEARLLGAARHTILEWGGPLDVLLLVAWPYTTGFLAALLVDRFPTALALAGVLFAMPELTAGLHSPDPAIRWSLFALFALFVTQRLFAPPGLLETRARSIRAAAGLTGFGILALVLGGRFV